MTASYRHLVAAGLALLGPATQIGALSAQNISLWPQLGFYIPTKDLVTVSQGGDVGKIEAGPSFGAALGLRFGSRFAIEASGAYVPTTFKLGTGNTIDKQDAKIFIGDAKAVFYLLSRGGVAFTSQSETSDVSGVFGAGAGIRLGGIMLVAGADFFRYTAAYQGSQQTAAELKQLDIALRIGLGFGFGGQ